MTPLDLDTLTPAEMEKLEQVHAENYHGTDDDMPDAFNDWLAELTVEAANLILNK